VGPTYRGFSVYNNCFKNVYLNPPNKTILIDYIKKMEEITHKENVLNFVLKANESDTGCKGTIDTVR
jgi:hypothetical protein